MLKSEYTSLMIGGLGPIKRVYIGGELLYDLVDGDICSLFSMLKVGSNGPIRRVYLGDDMIYDSGDRELEGFFTTDDHDVPFQVKTAPGATTYEDLWTVKI